MVCANRFSLYTISWCTLQRHWVLLTDDADLFRLEWKSRCYEAYTALVIWLLVFFWDIVHSVIQAEEARSATPRRG